VVNVLGVEDYVRGVVPNEMFAEPEAFKVQAVISRTLAVYVRDHEKRHAGDGFDLCTTGHCQVYRGVDSETPLADEAVKSTEGEVVTFRGRPILAAYHANAGGGTDEVDDVWPGSIKRDFIYLASVSSGFDTEANRLPGYEWCYRWQRTIDLEQVRERLAAAGKHVGQITDIAVCSKTRTGRVRLLEVVGTRGRAKVMGTSAVYETLGTPSSKLDLKKSGTDFIARGSGYGDGIGVSQHGALGMARVGYNHREILGYYYRGVSLAEDYGRGDSRSLPVPSVRLARR
jgi:stage II sporulation protein D